MRAMVTDGWQYQYIHCPQGRGETSGWRRAARWPDGKLLSGRRRLELLTWIPTPVGEQLTRSDSWSGQSACSWGWLRVPDGRAVVESYGRLGDLVSFGLVELAQGA